MELGAGQTTKQMREAPLGAVFVWCNDAMHYPRHLARALGRSDLKIIALRDLDHGGQEFRGRRPTGIVVDHAARLTERQFASLDLIRQWVHPAPQDGALS